MTISRTLITFVVVLVAARISATTMRAEFTSSHPDRWLQVNVSSRTDPGYPSKSALHAIQSDCGGQDFTYSAWSDSYWITPPTRTGAIVFVITLVDPLEIVDFHVRVGHCLGGGQSDPTHPWVTATMRLFQDGELISERQTQTRHCCETGFDSFPYIGSYPVDAIPPKIRFTPDSTMTSDFRKIMNHAQTLGGYPSPYQERLIGSPSVPDVGGMIEIEMLLTGADGSPAANTDVYVTVADPPDPALYRSDRKDGDNRDTVAPRVSGAPGYEVPPPPGSSATILRSDSAGKIFVRLHGSVREAGDNYRLRASLYQAVPATAVCSQNKMNSPCFESDVFTVWKRAVIEKDHMIRTGTFLAQPYGGGTQMTVVRTNAFTPSPGDTLIFMHAPRGTGAGFSEIRSIAGYKNGVVTLSQPLSGTYQGRDNSNAPAYTADAVGLWSSGFYELSLDPLRDAFVDAYITVAELPQSMPYYPYADRLTVDVMRELSTRWREGPANVHLVGARHYHQPSFGTETENFSYVWVQQCIAYTSENDPFRNEVAAHEVVHRWDVNRPYGRTSDHCQLQAYANGAHRCSMHEYVQQNPEKVNNPGPVLPQFRDGVVQFHYMINGTSVDSEYLGLRSKDGVQ